MGRLTNGEGKVARYGYLAVDRHGDHHVVGAAGQVVLLEVIIAGIGAQVQRRLHDMQNDAALLNGYGYRSRKWSAAGAQIDVHRLPWAKLPGLITRRTRVISKLGEYH